MGRIRTILVKRISRELMKEHEAEITEDFTKNKEVVDKYTKMQSSKMRNVVAGYTTRMARQKNQESKPRRFSPRKEDIAQFYKRR